MILVLLGPAALILGCARPQPHTLPEPEPPEEDSPDQPVDTGPYPHDPWSWRATHPDALEFEDTAPDQDTGTAHPCDDASPWVQVSAGYRISCGVHADGCAECWGQEGLFEPDSTPTYEEGSYEDQGMGRPPDEPFASVAVSRGSEYGEQEQACGIHLDGTLTCWGAWRDGQAPKAPAGTFTEVQVGFGATCAVATDGSVTCWGDDVVFLLDPEGPYLDLVVSPWDLAVIDTAGRAFDWGLDGASDFTQHDGPYTQLDAVWGVACGVQADGRLDCWSSYSDGETFLDPLPEGQFTAVCVPWGGACALDLDGQVTCFPEGLGFDLVPDVPLQSISCGVWQVCGVTLDGLMTCWGGDDYGESSPPPPAL